jgi:hypothetical protein
MASTVGSHPVGAGPRVETAVDVAILGGGLTGLAAAAALLELASGAAPPLRVTVMRGPSGRGGGRGGEGRRGRAATRTPPACHYAGAGGTPAAGRADWRRVPPAGAPRRRAAAAAAPSRCSSSRLAPRRTDLRAALPGPAHLLSPCPLPAPAPQPNALAAAAAISPGLRDAILERSARARQVMLHDTDGAAASCRRPRCVALRQQRARRCQGEAQHLPRPHAPHAAGPQPHAPPPPAGTIITHLHPTGGAGGAGGAGAAGGGTAALESLAPAGAAGAASGRHARPRGGGGGEPGGGAAGGAADGCELVIGWAELEALVLERLPPGVVEWGARVMELREEGGRVLLTVESGGGGGDDEDAGSALGGASWGVVSATVAVAADGALSAVCAACCPPGEGAEFQVRSSVGPWGGWGRGLA